MKINFIELDARRNDENFRETCGSFSRIAFILIDELRKRNLYTDNIDEATHVFNVSSLDLDFYIPEKVCFGIYFVDTLNTLADIQVYRARNNPNLKIFTLMDHGRDIFRKFGILADSIGPIIDADYWRQTLPKNNTFTFLSTTFSNIRSNVEETLRAFCFAFTNKDAKLIFKDTSNNPNLINFVNGLIGDGHDITYIKDRLTYSQIRDLYSQSHVTCNIMRHSGYSLPYIEAPLCNSVSLVGDFSPANQMMDQNNCIFLKPNSTINPLDNLNYFDFYGLTNTFNGLTFAEDPQICNYSIDDMVDLFRWTKENYSKFDLTARRNHTINKFDTSEAVDKLLNFLN